MVTNIFDDILYSQLHTEQTTLLDQFSKLDTFAKLFNPFNYKVKTYHKGSKEDILDYEVNHHGFRRLNESTSSTNIVTLGCSDTYGIGNYTQDLWSYKLSKKLKQPVWNLGTPGAGIDSCYMNLKLMSGKFKFDKVFFLVPSFYRTFLYFDHYDDNPQSELHRYTGSPKSIPDLKFKKCNISSDESSIRLALNHENVFSRAMMALDGIENICNKHNAKLYYLLHPRYYINNTTQSILNRGPFTLGTDNSHYGADFQELIFEFFTKLVDSSKNNSYI